MKKLLAILLATVMLFTVSLASCKKNGSEQAMNENEASAVTLEEVQADPLTAFENSLSVKAEDGLAKTFENIGQLENVHVGITSPDVAEIDVWASEKEDNFGFAIEADIEELDQKIVAHVTEKEFVAGVGNDVYGFPLDNLKEDFENAKFWEYAGITPDELYEAIEEELGFYFDELAEMLEKLVVELEAYDSACDEELLEVLSGAVKDVELRKVELGEGKLDAIVIEYFIDTDFIEDFSYWYLDVLDENPLKDLVPSEDYDETVGMYAEMFDVLIESFDENIEGITLEAAINPMNGRLSLLTITVDPDDSIAEDAEYIAEIDLGRDFTKSGKYVLNAYTKNGNDKVQVGAIVANSTNDGERISFNVLSQAFEDEKASDEEEVFAFRADLEDEKYALLVGGEEVASGDIEVKEGYFGLTIDGIDMKLSVDYDETSFEMAFEAEGEKLEFLVDDEKLPEVPAYKNIFEMDEKDFEQLAELLGAVERVEEVTVEKATVEETAAKETENSAALAEYAESIKQSLGSVEGLDMLDIDVTVRGDSLVYIYTYKIDVGDTATVKETLLSSFDGLEEQISGYVVQISEASGAYLESIIYEYYTMDGELIASREFR